MSSSDEEFELNYGIEDNSKNDLDELNNLDQTEDYDPQLNADKFKNLEERPRYKINPHVNSIEKPNEDLDTENDENLEDLLNLINEEEEEKSLCEEKDDNKDSLEPERKKFLIKKDKLIKNKTSDEKEPKESGANNNTPKKSATNTTPSKQNDSEAILKEKNTGIRIIKSEFKNEVDMNIHLACDYGKYYRLTEICRRMHEIKDSKDMDWFSIFVIGSKTEPKCSVKGNNYVIWQIFDLNNLEREQELSLFLFGGAYKSHWKSSEFDCFVLVKPEFLDSQKNTAQSAPNNSYNSNSFVKIGQNKKQKSDWNKFATKKVNQNLKLTLSVKSESQLVRLGTAKDISNCQSLLKSNPNQVQDAPKKCKNLVNLEKAPYCTYHCVQFDKNSKKKYSMDSPSVSRYGPGGLFPSTGPSSEFKFVPPNSTFNKFADLEARTKAVKEIKSEVIRSLTSSISKESPMMANILVKTAKKSDTELLAELNGKKLDKEELKKVRLSEQAIVRHSTSTGNDSASKEIKKLFNSKLLLPNENNITSISSQKLVDMKKTNSLSSTPGILSLVTNSSLIKEKYEDKKKNYGLSNLNNHKEILKEIKQKKNTENNQNDDKISEECTELGDDKPVEKLKASSFLKSRIDEIKKTPVQRPITPKKPADSGFDLELYIGDSTTSKKLMDVSSKYIPFSPSTATSDQLKRKLDQMSPGSVKAASPKTEDAKSKKLKMIEELKNIKSNHAKDARDPEKNSALRSFYNKLELEEKVDEKLSNMRNREVRVVTCATCSYTSFSQSDFCKLKKHQVKRHMVMQRFFKCKSCSKRTYTLDKIVPVASCSQCGGDKYEPCTMKDDNCKEVVVNKSTKLDQDSEMFFENE
ncbi:MCM10 -like protein [Brachionus plicatilis]|uniref:MCM10-like protein n=1 Tax=Brachionus plicatilis TaxID=10195 RepID=A0A3M7RLT2_BRAPC|nr:MCM10 -like protein [Brachionus plicatilis]